MTFNSVISDSPIRHIYASTIKPLNSTVYKSKNQSLDLPVISVKLNNKYRTYWDGLNRGKVSNLENKTDSTLSDLFMKHVLLHLCRLFGGNRSTVPNPVSYLVHLWNGQLFGETSYTWKAGPDMKENLGYLRRPFSTHNLYFVGFWFEDLKKQVDMVTGDMQSVQDFIANYTSQRT